MKKYSPSLFSITVAIMFLGLSFVYAWTVPTLAPPLGNVSAPLNTSTTTQIKTGDLTVNKITANSHCIGINCITAWPTSVTGLPTATAIGQTVRWDGTTWGNSSAGDLLVHGITIGNGNRGLGMSSNTVMGNSSMLLNTTGIYNTANGFNALYNNSTGMSNTANGSAALYNNTTGYYNVANGSNSLAYNETGYQNTSIGAMALYSNNGGNNTAVGYYSLFNNYTGSNNTAVGYFSSAYSTTLNYLTSIGANTFPSGDYSTVVGYQAATLGANSTALGNGASANTANQIRLGNTAVTKIGGQVAWSASSDRRLKEEITDYSHGLDFITKLRPVTFKFKADNTHIIHSGFIAQDVEATGIPFYGINKPANDKDYYSLAYSEFTVPLVNAVKELKVENDKLKTENNDLLTRIEKIEAKLK